ncbi:TetR/AcrR family transcriptional regulator [Paenibacillus albicereus]|uniref:TetR/AcrR family transcriptional regulator n=1 Tax=Paenibacillus albicereus TaxID=2726185 RepID=A0A6H2H3I4_9BACL|nr:TetR/AcrR family transcriptional regulator [Paenibacillus albicereus]QJC53898.1 TetR/AcrR family transcriptional regulator [Paenibacillus albicereus]
MPHPHDSAPGGAGRPGDGRQEPKRRSPGRPRREDRMPVRDEILKTASVLFMEQGYEAVSLSGIAERCGVTKASVYYHFEGKPALFTAAVIRMLQLAFAGTLRVLDQQGKSLRLRLLEVAERRLARIQHIEFEALMREASHYLDEEQRTAIRDAEQELHDLLAVHFGQAIAVGEIRQGNPMLMAHSYTALLMIGNRQAAKSISASPADLAAQIMDMFWTGVG